MSESINAKQWRYDNFNQKYTEIPTVNAIRQPEKHNYEGERLRVQNSHFASSVFPSAFVHAHNRYTTTIRMPLIFGVRRVDLLICFSNKKQTNSKYVFKRPALEEMTQSTISCLRQSWRTVQCSRLDNSRHTSSTNCWRRINEYIMYIAYMQWDIGCSYHLSYALARRTDI